MTCAKCRCAPPSREDSWCDFCRGVEALIALAWRRGITPGYRALAQELVVQTTRQVEAVFELDKRSRGYIESLTQRLTNKKEPCQPEGAGVPEPGVAPKQSAKPPLPRNSPRPVKNEAPAEEDTSSEEESPTAAREAKATSATEEGREAASAPSRPEREETRPTGAEERCRRSRSRNRGRRGGQRHQQKFRALEHPEKQFHRKLKAEPIHLKEGSQSEHPWRRDGRSRR